MKKKQPFLNHFFNDIRFCFEDSKLKTPTLLQMEATECGAAALGIVLGYYKKFISLEELRIACGISRDGSKAVNLLQAARHYGLEARGANSELEGLQNIPLPAIVFWKFNHFVVLEEITPKAIYINDPATGRRRVTPSEFSHSFTGIVLLLNPGPDFKPEGRPPQLLDTLKKRIEGSKEALAFLVLISVALIFPGIILPGFSKIFIDDILIKGLKSWLSVLLIGMFLTACFRSFLEILQQYYFLRFHMKLMITQSARFIWHVLKLPITFFEQRYAGDIANRIQSTDNIAGLVARDLSTSLVSIISLLFFAIVMFLYDWQLTLIGISASILNASLLWITFRQLSDMSRTLAQNRGKLEGLEINGLHVIETLKSSSLESQFFKRWAGNHAKNIQMQQLIAFFHQLLSILPALLSGLSAVIILILGGYRIIQGHMTVGTLVAFQSLLASFNSPINTLLGIGVELQEIRADITRLDDVFQHLEDPRYQITEQQPKSTPHSPENQPIVEFKNVTFGYSPLASPLLKNLSFKLNRGGQIALVGTTGSGKSTIAKLLCGLYRPWSGDILINQMSLSRFSPEKIAQTLSFVDQDILLFEGTIRDNLTLWDPDIPQEDLERAVQNACVSKLIHSRDDLFDSTVQEFGKNFSGGEQQRLEIARALVKNPSILVMDEGTSALDTITEQQIIQNLKHQGYSLLLITHRLNMIRDSDEIIVLDQGKVLERGNHQALMELNGYYSTLISKSV